jgi:hypothetical protein
MPGLGKAARMQAELVVRQLCLAQAFTPGTTRCPTAFPSISVSVSRSNQGSWRGVAPNAVNPWEGNPRLRWRFQDSTTKDTKSTKKTRTRGGEGGANASQDLSIFLSSSFVSLVPFVVVSVTNRPRVLLILRSLRRFLCPQES